MSDSDRQIRQVRIDVPLKTTCAYLFVDPDQKKWDPWWGSLYDYLLKLVANHPDWQYEPVQDVHFARPELSNEQKKELVSFLRNAPPREIQQHRTLRRAVELTSEQELKLELMCFSESTTKTPTDP